MLKVVYRHPLPMVCRPPTHNISTPYPWYIDPPNHENIESTTHGMSTPNPWYIDHPPMVYRSPYPWYIDPLPMVYQPPYP